MVKRLAVVFLFDSATKHKETDNMMLHREADNIPTGHKATVPLRAELAQTVPIMLADALSVKAGRGKTDRAAFLSWEVGPKVGNGAL